MQQKSRCFIPCFTKRWFILFKGRLPPSEVEGFFEIAQSKEKVEQMYGSLHHPCGQPGRKQL
jgi:hypothetical protein